MPDTQGRTYGQIRESIEQQVPAGIDLDEVTDGIVLSLVPPSERELPIVRIPVRDDIAYAWSSDDASATKLALELLGRLGQGVAAGPAWFVQLGLAVKDVVSFLIDLKRHSVRIEDPLQINTLLLLQKSDGGMTIQELRQRLDDAETSVSNINEALIALADADSELSARPLVRADGPVWKSLI